MDDEPLIARYIALDPLPAQSDGARLRMRRDGVAVWVLIRALLAARGNVLAVAAAYGLPREAVLAARTYYLRHPAPIDARIRAEQRKGGEPQRAA